MSSDSRCRFRFSSTTGSSSRISALGTGFCAMKVTVTHVHTFSKSADRVVYYSVRPGYSGFAASISAAAACTRSAVPSANLYLAFDGPVDAAAASVLVSTSTISSATRSNSAAPKPRVVHAGVPNRMPLEYQAPLGSLGIELRLVTTPESSNADSACRPVSPNEVTSSSTMWLSVPPVTSRAPRLRNPSASALALSAMRCAYAWNEGWRASASATALAAMTWDRGPPSTIGQPLSTAAEYSSVASTRPPRGPRSDLCVVVVVTWACGTGSSAPVKTLPATRPAKWAMSTIKVAPTSSAISRIFAKLTRRGYAE